ncbi:MAG: hypothetical protein R3330_18465, partial [Saprospiraceae bacterium]|nr:hypothetical protein [Saprospiraceae bacterium]
NLLTTVYIPGPADQTTGSTELILVAFNASGCPHDTSRLTIAIETPPSATLSTDNATVCNAAAEGSILDLTALVTGGDTSGLWADLDTTGIDLTDPTNVDFDGVAAGMYTLSYSTQSAMPPCTDSTYLLVVNVQDCSCPELGIVPVAEPVCNNDTVDLSALLLTSEPGAWSIIGTPAGTLPAMIDGDSVLITTAADTGLYTLKFTLDNPVAGCPDTAITTITVWGQPELLTLQADCSGPELYAITFTTTADSVSSDLGVLTSPGGTDYLITGIPDTSMVIISLMNGPCMITGSAGPLDCSCPELTVAPMANPVCNSGFVNLADLVITSAPGTWSMIGDPGGASPAVVESDSLLNVTGADPGVYTL